MVQPRRGAGSSHGHTMRSGIDLFQPDELFEAGQLVGLEALARALSIMENARPAWHADAACKGSSVDFTSPAKATIREALAICSTCPVMLECRSWSVSEIEDNVSVLGGLDAAARRQARKTAQRQTNQQTDDEGNDQ